ncbi:MAG: hypothetical protein MPN21_12285 [Thermoanaerobaculia bacterium]|nr:hypothetical protein [Thermoanaerobaculia bacterium]
MAPKDEPTLESVLADLGRLVRSEVARHPQGHLLATSRAELELSLRVPIAADATVDSTSLRASADDLRAEARQEIAALLLERTAFRPGHVISLRQGSSVGEDTAPPDARYVFAGWSPSGVPRFLDFAQLLLERQHEEQHRLYQKPPGLLTFYQDREDLRRELLPAFASSEPTLDGGETAAAVGAIEIHGQTVAGWFRVPRTDGNEAVLALTLQAVSVGVPGRTARRYDLNVLGTGPDGEPLSEVVARLEGAPPWKAATDWAQKALRSLGHGRGENQRRSRRKNSDRKKGDPKKVDGGRREGIETKNEERIRGILGGLARRLEQRHRARRRRTVHAQERHDSGDRPTRMALRDLARAGVDEVFVDQRRDTMVVVGERGRAHVFNGLGKLVTSIRYTPESIERKRRQDIWRPASPNEVQRLRKTVGV